jgi:hypothetical protein
VVLSESEATVFGVRAVLGVAGDGPEEPDLVFCILANSTQDKAEPKLLESLFHTIQLKERSRRLDSWILFFVAKI